MTILTGMARTCVARKQYLEMIAITFGVPSVSCVTIIMKDTGMPLIKNVGCATPQEGNVAVDTCRFIYWTRWVGYRLVN